MVFSWLFQTLGLRSTPKPPPKNSVSPWSTDAIKNYWLEEWKTTTSKVCSAEWLLVNSRSTESTRVNVFEVVTEEREAVAIFYPNGRLTSHAVLESPAQGFDPPKITFLIDPVVTREELNCMQHVLVEWVVNGTTHLAQTRRVLNYRGGTK